MNKQALIEKRLKKPFEVGDKVNVTLTYVAKKSVRQGRKHIVEEEEITREFYGMIEKIYQSETFGELLQIDFYSSSLPYEVQFKNHELDDTGLSYSRTVKSVFARQATDDCGANPFKPRRDIRFTSSSIETLLFKGGYGRRLDDYMVMEVKTIGNHPNEADIKDATYGGINFNPYVTDSNGERVYFQRDLIWTLEQKQNLISSIYNGIEIGKFIFRYKSWEYMRSLMLKKEHAYDFDCIDGKQRYHAILDFVQNKFTDEFGNYWNDLSVDAQRAFLNYGNLACGELGERSTDEEAIEAFLAINFTGTPMSKEHIKYVQSIKL